MTPLVKRIIVGVALAAAAGIIVAQSPALTRTIVAKGDLSAVPGREAVVARVEVAPGGVGGWHTHPGEEVAYITEGEAMLLMAGQPPRRMSAGDAVVIPAGVVHSARNDSSAVTRLVAVYLVDKGQPLSSPASAPAP
jgi:quercetin dioxygenase-like cupin family protein